MNDEMELEIMELGDAKEETKGTGKQGTEENPALPHKI